VFGRTTATIALAAAMLALTAAPASAAPKNNGDKVSGSGASRPVAQALPTGRLPPRPTAGSAAVNGQGSAPAKLLAVPTNLTFDVRPTDTQVQVVVMPPGDVMVHLEQDRYGDGDGQMTLLGPGNVALCQTKAETCVLHVAEGVRYVLSVHNAGAAKGAFVMVFSLPRVLPTGARTNLGNLRKPKPGG
jgi:hypothetical protein